VRRSELEAVDVQLLGQLTPAVEWQTLLAYWQHRNPSGVGGWPRFLEPAAYALNLWPMPAGRVGRAAGIAGDVRKRQPRQLLCTPGLAVFTPGKLDAETVLAGTCAGWLEDVGTSTFHGLRLAPPVLESWATGGRLLSREVVDFGLSWTLPAPDGV